MNCRSALLAITAAAALTLAACGSDDDNEAQTTAPSTTAAETGQPKTHALGDTITIGNTLTISDTEIDTTGCTFDFPEDVKRDAVKFEVLATVDNQTGEDIPEALWASDFTFLDTDGLTVKTMDIASAEGPCDNDNAHQFVDLKSGEKRRAAVTLEAPANATTMTYTASTIAGAEPVTWDISEDVKSMSVTPAGGGTAPQPSPAASTPEPLVAETPVVPQQAEQPTATCATDYTLYQPGTVFYSDGTSGYSAACQQQMENAMEASGQFPDYPFGQVDPNWTEEDAMRGGTAGNAETGGAGTPNDCDGYLGAHESADDSHC